MSFQGYTPTPSPAGTVPPATPAYTYGAYHPQTYGTAGAYAYPPTAYQTGVTGYGWSYPYSYQLPTTGAQGQQTAARPGAASGTSGAAASIPQRSAYNSYAPSYPRDNVPAVSTGARGGRRQSNLKGLFTKELKNLMYGFGDDRNPASDTVNVMEEILIEYITDVCQVATGPTKKSRLSIDDLRRALSRPADAKKLARMEELLFMQEDIKRARAQFEESDIHNPNGLNI